MKMGMKTTAIASILALALMSGTAMAQTETGTTAPQQQMQQMGGKMMKGKGQGMMGGGMMQGQGGMGCMKMQGQGMMGNSMMNSQGCQGMMSGKGMMMQGGMGCMKMMGQGMGMGMMGGGMMKNMSAENQQKFMDATKETRKEMHMLHFEHMEAMRNPKTTLEDLSTMEQKMLDTRKEMMKKAKSFQAQKN